MGYKNGLIDLHVHLDGSLSVPTVRRLAKMQRIAVPTSDATLRKQLSVSDTCRDLNEYLEKFEFPLSLLLEEAAIEEAVYSLLEELRTEGLIYAEIRFAPQLHCRKGMTQKAVVDAAMRGQKRSVLRSGLILCCMRMADNYAENMETVRLAAENLGKGVVGLDLAGAEALYPTQNFDAEFAAAREAGIPLTVHAGEAAGPESVYAAIEAGAKRIGHGVRSAEDKALLNLLCQSGVTLECCPTSNLQTRVFFDISEYPVRTFLEAGVKFTINTDNLTVSDTTLRREWALLSEAFSLTEEEKGKILISSIDAAFSDTETKAAIRAELKAAAEG